MLLIIQHREPALLRRQTDAVFQAAGPGYSEGVNEFAVGLVAFEEVRNPFDQAQVDELPHPSEEIYSSIFASLLLRIG